MKALSKLYENLKKIKPEAWIALMSLVLSIYAIKISQKQFDQTTQMNIEQLKLTKKHNMLSVKPILNLNYYLNRNLEKIGFEICNKGLGPATIVSQKILLGGNVYYNFDDVSMAISRSHLTFWDSGLPSSVNLISSTLNPEQTQFIYWINTEDVTDFYRAEQILIQNLEIYITYRDIYNNLDTVYYKHTGNKIPIEIEPEYRLQ